MARHRLVRLVHLSIMSPCVLQTAAQFVLTATELCKVAYRFQPNNDGVVGGAATPRPPASCSPAPLIVSYWSDLKRGAASAGTLQFVSLRGKNKK